MGQDSTETEAVAAGVGASELPGAIDPIESPADAIDRLNRQIALAAPRLEAFAKLEKLAREQRSTPEAIAVQVTIDVLVEDKDELQEEVDRLAATKTSHQDAVAVLAQQRDDVRDELDRAQAEFANVIEETTDLLGELESIRSDAVRLLGEKAALEVKVESLRNEVALLLDERHTIGGVLPESGPVETVVVPTESAAEPSKFESVDDSDEAHAFDKFFDVDIGKDKARAWMLE